MLRYCKNCKKDYEFEPLAVSGKEPLICPECGNVIGKNSKNPGNKVDTDKTDEKIGNGFAALLHLSYIFYLVMGIIGVLGFVLGVYFLLYVTAFISLTVFLVQLITGTSTFGMGIIFIPLGAIAGFIFIGAIPGACLGIHLVFLIRHLIRDVFWRLFWKLIEKVPR